MALQNVLNVLIEGQDNLTPALNQLESRLIRFVGAVSSALATVKLASFPITQAGDFERELANVKKTTGFAKTEINELGDSLLKLSLRINVSQVDLAKIAAAAGQQGLGSTGVKGIEMFTESIARMSSVLDITAEQAASDTGKILNIFKIPITDIEKVVSTFNQVSNNSTAKGRELLDVVKRIGDAAGTINFQQSVALGATGIDLGMSPEVVGTSYTKIFAQLITKAKEYTDLLNRTLDAGGKKTKITQDEWVARVKRDGILAYQDALARLRQLDDASQAKAINTYMGQGRVFGLGQKQVNERFDQSLNKNIANSTKGWDTGTSAMDEQRTVLATLNAQWEILVNSIKKVATEGGMTVLQKITAHVQDLSAALQSPAIKSGVGAIVGALGDVVDRLASGIKTISDWNVNWGNFIKLAGVFLQLKLGAAFLSMAGNMLPGVTMWKTYSANMREAIATSTAAGTALTAQQLQFVKLAGTIRLVSGAITLLTRAFSGILFWGTVIYSILDAFHLLDGLPSVFQKFTDALGLTSEAQRKKNERDKEELDLLDKKKQKLQEVIDKYDEYVGATGRVDAQKLKNTFDSVGAAPDNEGRVRRLQEIGEGAAGFTTVNANAKENADSLGAPARDAVGNLRARLEENKKLQEQYRREELTAQAMQNVAAMEKDKDLWKAKEVTAKALGAAAVEEYKRIGIALGAAMNVESSQVAAGDGVRQRLEDTKQNLQEYTKQLGTLFSSESANVFLQYVLPLIEKTDEAVEAKKKFNAEYAKGAESDPEKEKKRQEQLKELKEKMDKAAESASLFAEQFRAAREAILALPGLPQNVINSMTLLNNMANLPLAAGQGIAAGLKAADANSIPLTASAAPVAVAPKTPGTIKGPPTREEESEAHKLASAKARLARADADALAALQKEKGLQSLANSQFLYDRGLRDIRKFYEEKNRIELQGNTAEQKAKEDDIAALNTKLKAQTKESGRVSVLAEIAKEKGALRVIKEQRKEIENRNERDLDTTGRTRSIENSNAQLSLIESLGLGEGTLKQYVDKAYDAALMEMQIKIRQIDAEITAQQKSGDLGGSDGITALSKQKADLQAKAMLDSIGKGFALSAVKTDQATAALDRYNASLQIGVAQGKLTDLEVTVLQERARAATVKVMEAELQKQEALLQTVDYLDKQSIAYLNLTATISKQQLAIAQLKNTNDQVAQSINSGIQNTIATFFTDLTKAREKSSQSNQQQMYKELDQNNKNFEEQVKQIAYLQKQKEVRVGGSRDDVLFDEQIAKGQQELVNLQQKARDIRRKNQTEDAQSFTETLKKMALSFIDVINGEISKALAQSLMKSFMGGGGNEGIGGWISKLMKGGAATELDKPTGSESSPFFVKNVDMPGSDNSPPTGNNPDEIGDPKLTMFDLAKKKAETMMSSVTGGVIKSFDQIGKAMDGVLTSVGGAFNQMMAMMKSSGGGTNWIGTAISIGSALFGGSGGETLDLSGQEIAATDYTDNMLDEESLNAWAAKQHGGGIAGRASMGGRVSPGVFAGAMRYHSGGIAGLSPDEVPTILKKGEEVITEADPRHRNQGGASSGDNIHVETTVNMDGESASSTSDSAKGKAMGDAINNAIIRTIQQEKRPGGLLAK